MNVHELVAPCLTSVEQLGSAAIAELRSDHAGETGAVYIYEGILAVSQSTELRAFAESHLRAEQIHLAALDRLLPHHLHSKCLPLWRVAGWGLGAFAALLGPHFTYATIRAVETFVVEHYQQQLDLFPQPLRTLLEHFCDDEAQHRNEAQAAMQAKARYPAWHWIVSTGSAVAVQVARRL